MKKVPVSWVDDTTTDAFGWYDDGTGGGTLTVQRNTPSNSLLSPQQQFILTIAQRNRMASTNSVWNTPSATSSPKYFTPSLANTIGTSVGNMYVNNIVIDTDGSTNYSDTRDTKNIHITLGTERTIHLPDGSKIEVKADGSYEILDQDAKITYRASRFKDFNSFLNASDKLEEFIKHCDSVGVRKSEVLRLPLELFIAWLIISAARQDDMPAPELPLETTLRRKALPKCTGCGRFLGRSLRERSLEFCAPRCYGLHQSRALAAPPRPSALVPVAQAA